jgi:hypothetical protein
MEGQTRPDGFWKLLLAFIRLTRPLFLLGVAIVYALGAGIARYLGVEIDWNAYLLGQAWVTFIAAQHPIFQ